MGGSAYTRVGLYASTYGNCFLTNDNWICKLIVFVKFLRHCYVLEIVHKLCNALERKSMILWLQYYSGTGTKVGHEILDKFRQLFILIWLIRGSNIFIFEIDFLSILVVSRLYECCKECLKMLIQDIFLTLFFSIRPIREYSRQGSKTQISERATFWIKTNSWAVLREKMLWIWFQVSPPNSETVNSKGCLLLQKWGTNFINMLALDFFEKIL